MAATGYAEPIPQSRTPALFGRVMGLVALTVAVATLGVYLFRESGGALWFIAWLLALGCLVGLNVANSRGNQSLALGLLLAFGLLIGASVSSTVNYYATDGPDGGPPGVRRHRALHRRARRRRLCDPPRPLLPLQVRVLGAARADRRRASC